MGRPCQHAYVLCLAVLSIHKKDLCMDFGHTDGKNMQTLAVTCWSRAVEVSLCDDILGTFSACCCLTDPCFCCMAAHPVCIMQFDICLCVCANRRQEGRLMLTGWQLQLWQAPIRQVPLPSLDCGTPTSRVTSPEHASAFREVWGSTPWKLMQVGLAYFWPPIYLLGAAPMQADVC